MHDEVGLLHDRAGADYLGGRHILDELGDVVVGRLGYYLLGRALLDDDAVAHDGDAVAQFEGFVEVMGDEDDRLLQIGLQGK